MHDYEKPGSPGDIRRMNAREKPGSPGELLHYGVKGMRWGVRKKEDATGRDSGGRVESFTPGTPEFQQVVERVTRTDKPQMLGTSGRVGTASTKSRAPEGEREGLSKEQKMLLAFGAATAAAAGYYAYKHYTGNQLVELADIKSEQQILEGMKLPAKWDVRGLKDGPISTTPLGMLGRGDPNIELLDKDNLVINTARGYADILPKDGFKNAFAAEQHASVTRVLEEMREKYPTIRNMNIEVLPMSHAPGITAGNGGANMCVLGMGPGEARVMYNDLMDKPSAAIVHANRKFLPGLGKKDYVAYHEMGHLLAVAHGDIPPALDMLTGKGGPSAMKTWQKAEPLLHKRTFKKHGFSFKELSKLSQYAATEPAEAMAELVGHYFQPEMRARLSADQLRRAQAMINEMGGLG